MSNARHLLSICSLVSLGLAVVVSGCGSSHLGGDGGLIVGDGSREASAHLDFRRRRRRRQHPPLHRVDRAVRLDRVRQHAHVDRRHRLRPGRQRPALRHRGLRPQHPARRDHHGRRVHGVRRALHRQPDRVRGHRRERQVLDHGRPRRREHPARRAGRQVAHAVQAAHRRQVPGQRRGHAPQHGSSKLPNNRTVGDIPGHRDLHRRGRLARVPAPPHRRRRGRVRRWPGRGRADSHLPHRQPALRRRAPTPSRRRRRAFTSRCGTRPARPRCRTTSRSSRARATRRTCRTGRSSTTTRTPAGAFSRRTSTTPGSTPTRSRRRTLADVDPAGTQSYGGMNGTIDAVVQTTLPNGATFPRGVAMKTWLGNVGALQPSGELQIDQARHNAVVGRRPTHASVPWIVADMNANPPNETEYFSFDTPFGASPAELCGRVVYSDLHVGAASMDYGGDTGAGTIPTNATVPSGCTMGMLSAQEKALEFMLFDLSGCVTPSNQPAGGVPRPRNSRRSWRRLAGPGRASPRGGPRRHAASSATPRASRRFRGLIYRPAPARPPRCTPRAGRAGRLARRSRRLRGRRAPARALPP